MRLLIENGKLDSDWPLIGYEHIIISSLLADTMRLFDVMVDYANSQIERFDNNLSIY
jgi:hypothetical protein